MRTFLARLRDMFRRRRIAAAFDDEMRYHLEQLEALHRERGLSPEAARAAAAREFGNATRAREDLRDRAGFPAIEGFVRDVWHAWRGLSRQPLLASGVVGVLAIGLGAAGTLWSLTHAVLFAPLPVPHPDELHVILRPEGGGSEALSHASVRRLDALLHGGSAAGYSGANALDVQVEGRPVERRQARLVTGAFFGVLGLEPAAGRLLAPADDTPDAPAVAVVSHRWAVDEFGTAAGAVGRQIWVNRQAVAIVGVLPPRFISVTLGQGTELWVPTSLQQRLQVSGNAWVFSSSDRPNDPDWTREERVSWLTVLLRLPSQARATAAAAIEEAVRPQLEAIAVALDDPAERESILRERYSLVHAPGGFSPARAGFRPISLLLGGVVALVLVLACANVSGLLLVRTLSRHRELGVRLALGSGRWRIVRLATAESLLVCAGGAAAGVMLSLALVPVLHRLLLPGRELAEVVLEPGLLAIMAALTLLCSALCGVGPALLIGRMHPLAALAGHGGLHGAAGRIGRMLVAAQLALAVVLVAVAATLGREIVRTLAADPGFARETVLTASFDAKSAGYEPAQAAVLVDRIDAALRGVPGVADVGFAACGILAGNQSRSALTFRHPDSRIHGDHIQGDVVRPGYFAATGMTLLVGRDFAAGDRADTPPVAVINATLARRAFGDADPIGQRFGFGATPSDDDFTVVGVVADAKLNDVRDGAPAMFFRCAAQATDQPPRFVAVRIAAPAEVIQPMIKAALSRTEPGLPFRSWRTLEQRLVEGLGPARAATGIATTLAAIAIILASAGVAASLGYLVTLRRRELALRIALGADPREIRRAVLIDALKLGLVGAGVGLALVWLLPFIPSVGERLPARPDMLVGAIAAATGLGATLAAAWSPARRAGRAELLLLLKQE